MSDSEKVDSTKGRINSLIKSITGMVAEDPLIAGFFLAIVIPLAYIGGQSALAMKVDQAFVCIGLIGASVIVVFAPLLILRSKRGELIKINETRSKVLEEERVRRQETWIKNQQRADAVMNAKIQNLQAQTNYLNERAVNFEKMLIHEAAKEFSEAVNLRFGSEEEFVNAKDCVDRFKLITDSFHVLNGRYDKLDAEVAEVIKSIEKLSRAGAEDYVNIKVEDHVKSPQEIPSVTQDVLEIAPVDIVEGTPDQATAKLTVTYDKPMETEDELEEALSVLDEMTEEEENPGEPEPPKKKLPADIWECYRCGRQTNIKRDRCPTCGFGQAASKELRSKEKKSD